MPNTNLFKATIICFVIVLIYNFSFAQKSKTEETRVINDLILKPINQLIVKGNVIIYLSQSTEPSIFYEGNKSKIKQLKTLISNETLSITNKNYSNDKIKIYLTLSNIENLQTIGNVEIETPTNIILNKLNLTLSEESEATLFVNSNDLKLEVHGNGELNLSGYIDTLRIKTFDDCEVYTKLKSKKVLCKTTNNSNIKLQGVIFDLYISSFKNSYADALNCEVGNSFIVSFDESDVKFTSIEAPEIYAFDKSTIYYKSPFQAFVMENSNKSFIKKEIIKTITKK
ncbi:MAG: hypothetical protein COZ21_10730 [Bacteroidetes bacterium CG_4_10_14_3_um_filter_31_20]|nr:hypothetical protein [Bacteroidota bacterium]PIY03098.1 MAG: hypothetical protein COZ21_10730 [Bacteroidetes bacterium CG_4_10_14_3_um_filter_31_20]